jgi:hypothetical protein
MRRIFVKLSFENLCPLGILPLAILVALLTGCSTTNSGSASQTSNLATTAATTAAGAYIGGKGGSPQGAAIGAAAGFVAGETISYLSNKSQREAYLAGYEKGRSDAVKQQYWIARDNQRPSADDGYEEGFYEIDVPASDQGGVRREATKRVVRVVLPKETGS